jgi:hypothetical protein
MKAKAKLSEDRKYRYWLLRVWDETLPIMAIIGVNPSIADETKDDPTIRKDIGFASRLSFGGILKLNIAAFRATDPKKCRDAKAPIGIFNDVRNLRATVDRFKAKKVVAAWGNNGNYFPNECRLIIEGFPELWCWGRTKNGSPRHTARLPYTTPLEKFGR